MTESPVPSIKILVSGPVGAGKTTFTRALSEVDALGTEEVSSVMIGKETTTVALDFGSLCVGDQNVMLFGTPGQERFDYMWEILCEGAAGLVLLVAGNRPEELPLARKILEFVISQTTLPFVIGVTHLDVGRAWDPTDIAAYFEIAEKDCLGADARDRDSASQLLLHLLERIDERAD